jgi:hypothetical protein
MTALAPTAAGTMDLPQRLERPVLALFGALASTILLKVAGVQYLEILEFLLMAYLVLRFAQASFQIQLSGVLVRISAHYAVLMLLMAAGALWALTRPIYIQTSGLYRPGVFSASRLLELILDVAAMIILADIFRRSPAKCLFTMRIFFWVGTLSAFYGILGNFTRVNPFGVAERAAGFFNEGGPFGLYLLSNIAVGWVLRSSEGRYLRIAITLAFLPNLVALVLSASKAAYLGIGLMLLLQALMASSLRQRIAVVCVFAIMVGLILSYTTVSHGVMAYTSSAQDYVLLSNLFPTNYNLVVGRVAGLFLVPRMIATHPWTGVGLANYGLVRNAYEYRGASVWVTVADTPGLGLAGMVAEIGIPTSLYLLYILFLPLAAVRRSTAWTPLISLVLVQPIVHLVGAQLNVTYPWMTTAFALGLAGAGISADTIRSYKPGLQGEPIPVPNT